MATNKSKLDLSSLVPEANHDAILLGVTPASKAVAPPPAEPTPTEPPARVRFTNTMDPEVWRHLHEFAYWQRLELNAVLEMALNDLFAKHPDAQRPLPEAERKRRKLL